MNNTCIVCGKELAGKQVKYCSNRCNSYHHSGYVLPEQREQLFCIVCGKKLVGRQRKLCSKECRQARGNERHREYYQKPSVIRQCIVCEKELSGNQRKFCSNICKNRDYNIRKCERYHNDDEYREKMLREQHEKYHNDETYRERKIKRDIMRVREKRKDPAYREEVKRRDRKRKQEKHKDLEWREKVNERTRKCMKVNYRRSRGLPEDCNLTKESSIETIMKRWLLESDIDFVQHYYIDLKNSTRTWVDFFIPEPNICLYCDGDYWHGPERPDIQERDARINKALEAMGHSVVRMSETEIVEGNRPWWIGELISAKW